MFDKESGKMLGGKVVKINGKCFINGEKIK
jgi:hypothetical protein